MKKKIPKLLPIASLMAIVLPFIDGIFGRLNILGVLLGLVFKLIGIIAAILCLISIISDIAKKQLVTRAVTIWIVSCLILAFSILSPNHIFTKAAAITQAKIIGTSRIVKEGRTIIAAHENVWNPDGNSLDNQRELTEIPTGIKSLFPLWVRVYPGELEIKKSGFGDMAGFIIVAEGKNSKGLKIADGLYWIDPTME